MSKMGYNPAGAASCLNRQGKSEHPHGPGGLPPAPKGSDGGRNMHHYNPKAATGTLRKGPPDNRGPGAGNNGQ